MATESQTTATKNPYAPNAQKAKFRSTLGEIMRKRKDPEYARHVLTDVMGIDEAIVDQELVRYQAVSAGQPAPPEQALAPELSSPQQQRVDAINTVSSLMKNYRDLYDKYTTDDGLGIQITGEQAAELKTAKSTIEFAIANAVGTGALQAADRAVVQDLLPDPTGILSGLGIAVRGGKKGALASIDTALAQFKASRETIETGKAVPVGPTGAKTPPENGSLKVDTNKEVNLNTPEEAAKWVQQFPDDPRAEEVKKSLERVGFKPSQEMIDSSRQAAIQDLVKQGVSDPVEIKKILDEQSSSQGLGQSDFSLEEIRKLSGAPSTPSTGTNTDFIALGGALGEGIGSFTGGNKIGEAIGNVIGGQLAKNGEAGQVMQDNLAKLTQLKADGKIDEEKYNMLVENLEKTAKEAFGYTGPSFKEVAGDAIKVAATFLGGGAVRGATLAGTALRTAAVGATYSAGNAMAEDKDLRGVVIDALIGGAVAGSIPVIGKVLGKGYKAIVGKNTPEEALGEIIQGKTKDLKPGQRALAAIDASEVKTYEDLASKLDDNVSFLSGKVDELLGKDKTLTPLAQLATETKSKSGKVVTSNYVQKAIQDLEELYTKTGDNVNAQNMRELLQQAETNGLTKLDVNQIAREYGKAYKSFTKFGEQLTSVNSKMYENTRSGLKEVARRGLNGEAAKNLDGLISDTMHTRELIEKNVEAVNKLEQRAEKMGLGRTIVTKAIRAIDIATLGGTRAIRESLIQSNVGKKTMNAFDVETKLQDNLKIIEKALKASTPGKLEKALQELNKKLLNSVKGKGGLSLQDVSGGKAGYSDDLLQEARKYKSVEEFEKSLNLMKWGKVTGVGELPIDKLSKSQLKVLLKDGLPENGGSLKVSDFKSGRKVTQPIEVSQRGSTFVVENGRHRLFQALANGDQTIPVAFKSGEGKAYSTPLTDLWKKAQGETKRGFGTGAGRMKNEMEKISLNVGEVYTKGKKIKESILNELADFTEYAAKQKQGSKIERIPEEIRARAIAEKLGINPDVSNWMLSKKFGKLLKDNNWNR